MTSWVVVAFELDWQAGEALEHLLELETINQIHIDNAAVMSVDDDGRHHLRQTKTFGSGAGAAGGGLIGFAIGALIPGGAVVAAAGFAAGAVVGSHEDRPAENPLAGHLAAALEKGRSVLAVEYHDAVREAVLAELEPFAGEVVEGSLTAEQVAALNRTLSEG